MLTHWKIGASVAGVVIAAGIALGSLFWTGLLDFGRPSTLTVALPTFGAEVLDPSEDSQAGHIYYGHMYDRLIGDTPNGKPSAEMGVLERWDINAGATEYTFTLRTGVRWHDGSEVTAEDVAASLAHYSRTAAACVTCGGVYDSIEDVQIVDRQQLQIRLKKPDLSFIDKLGPEQEDVPLFPVRYLERVGQTGFADEPIGSGPWQFVSRVPGEYIEYEANSDYWNADRIPGFQRLRLLLVPETEKRVEMLRSGQVDIAAVTPGDVETLKTEGFSVQGPKYTKETTLRFQMSYDSGYLTSKLEFRKALTLGMDLWSIVQRTYPAEAATLGGGSPMFGPLDDGYDPDLPPYPYDPGPAQQLLNESGYKGETVSLISIPVYGLTEIPLLNEMIADSWRQMGLNVAIVPTTYGPVKARFSSRPQRFEDLSPAPLFHGGHVSRPGGIINSIYRYMTGSPDSLISYYDVERGERIYEELAAMPSGPTRTQRLKELNRELYEEYWAAPIIWRHEVYGVRPGLAGWTPRNGSDSHLHLETVRRTQ